MYLCMNLNNGDSQLVILSMVPLPDELGPHVLVVGQYGSMLGDLVRTFGA